MGVAATMYDSLIIRQLALSQLRVMCQRKVKVTICVTLFKNDCHANAKQDPTKPMENTDLTSQLAQIATLESMNKLSDSVSGISQQIGSGQSLQATQLVGKGVLIPRNEIILAPLKKRAQVKTAM